MYPDKQDKNQKLRKAQGLYRKKRNKNRTDYEESKIWTLFMNSCYWALFFLIVVGVLFDMGVPLPAFFGR